MNNTLPFTPATIYATSDSVKQAKVGLSTQIHDQIQTCLKFANAHGYIINADHIYFESGSLTGILTSPAH